jgi:hypothetical protein
MAKSVLPGMALPCGLCRASTHGNAFGVPIVAFAVQISLTAMLAFPVVTHMIVDDKYDSNLLCFEVFLQRKYFGTGSQVNFFFAKFIHKSKPNFLLLEDLINLKVTKYFKIFLEWRHTP